MSLQHPGILLIGVSHQSSQTFLTIFRSQILGVLEKSIEMKTIMPIQWHIELQPNFF